jgi:catechol 2,3-dioxygenase-like lactoylglutathione lyase family enzyme|tara:strand:+ start:2624 stop:3031 length:408 start_codon:yes stop_codon:yes gene_type:complete
MPEINPFGIAGIIIWTSRDRFAKMEDFYVDKLGLVPLHHRDHFVNFKWPGDKEDIRLTIGVHSEIQTPSTDPERIMINLHVRNIHAIAKHLSSAGINFIRKPEQESWGGWIATMRDPDNNTIQLLQSPNETSQNN